MTIAALVLVSAAVANAQPVDFVRDIQPIFAAHCHECHGPDLRESGLRTDDRGSLLKGGDRGMPAVVPGKPGESLLLELVRSDDPDSRMPPDGDRLTPEQVRLLSRWIEQGAEFPDGDADSIQHWSFQPLRKPDLPADSENQHPIDAFIGRELHKTGLQLSEPAERHTLVRRLFFDLTGLPPAPADVQAFASAADRDVAWEALVEQLLASPRYGERWAQHWLDIIRWAETVGFETNLERPNAWPYRDWVIAALNADKPYDDFLFAQIAGDTSGEDAALGFLVAGPANLPGQIGRDEEAMRQARQDELDEVIRTVSQSIFALTLDCARCHSHKFDPLTQRDYYAMQATFAGLQYGDRRLRGGLNDEWTSQVPQVRERLQTLREELEALRIRHALQPPLTEIQAETFEPVEARAVRMRIHATGNGAAASLYEFEAWSTAHGGESSVNVALAENGATPSASSFALANQTRHFDNLVDGSVDQRQAFPWVSAAGGPAWIRIDFPKSTHIDRTVWHRGESIPADYDIDVLPPSSDEWITVLDSRRRLPRTDDARHAASVRLTGLDSESIAEVMEKTAAIRSTQQTLNRVSAGPQVYAASFIDEPEDTWLLRRGDPMQRVDIVVPSVPEVLRRAVASAAIRRNDGTPAVSASARRNRTFDGQSRVVPTAVAIPANLSVASEVSRRLALAEHAVRPDHPLTARVIVNRIWQSHFGTGLVDTPSDFGRMGSRPTHPELLDWLAADFVEHGWSLKRLHRQIVTSDTFRQSSRPNADALQVDAGSRLLWRFPPRRLEAEAIRDAILTVSGKLNMTMGGPGFDLFNQRGGLSDYVPKETFDDAGWRRMIYAHKIRMQAVDIFGSFDCPDAGQMTPQRTRSITPLQSLSLLNSPFANRQAEFFAERVRTETGDDLLAQVNRSFVLALSRPPTNEESLRMIELAETHGLEQVCRVLVNTSEFLFLQ
ncbi:MAG: DUF1553 domain-containing protein [Planctomycetaceae bacterium]